MNHALLCMTMRPRTTPAVADVRTPSAIDHSRREVGA
jgi:hypothetical protein